MSSDPGAADRLSDYLDALVTGEAAQAPDLDPSLAATIADFFAADDAPAPPPDLADHVWRDLMDLTAAPEFVPLVPAAGPDRNGHASSGPQLTKLPNHPTAPPRRGPAALAALTTAALLALALLGSLLALRGSLRVVGPEPRAISLPGRDITPVPARPSIAGTESVLLRSRLDQAPSSGGPQQLALYRLQLAPGAVELAGSQADSGAGPNQFTVEAGRVTVAADAPVLVTRAGANAAAPASRVEPGTTVTLDVGDQIMVPSGVRFRRRNDGSAPATLLGFSIGTVGDNAATGSLPPGVTYVGGFPVKRLSAIPEAPVEMTVQRRTLAPGDKLAVRDAPGLALVYVEAGALDLVSARAETPATPARAVAIPAGSGTGDFGPTPERAVLANRDAEPVVILTASVVSTSAGKPTPPAASVDGWGTGDRLPGTAP